MTEQYHKPDTCLCKLKKRRLKVRRAFGRELIGEIQLKGKWLQAAGFAIDSPVTVKVMEQCLVITTEHSG